MDSEGLLVILSCSSKKSSTSSIIIGLCTRECELDGLKVGVVVVRV